MTNGLMADALYPENIPTDTTWQAVATEIDNTENPAAWRQLQTRFPILAAAGRVLPICVAGSDVAALGTLKVATAAEDIERGALTPTQAAQAVADNVGRPIPVYFSVGDLAAVEQALGRPWNHPAEWPAPGPYKWDADWTGRLHVNPDSIATQFDSPTINPAVKFDTSAISPFAPTFPAVPAALPAKSAEPTFHAAAPPVAIIAPGQGGLASGYWIVCVDGGVFNFGKAAFHGSAAGKITAPIVAAVATLAGAGYWLLGEDGAIFGFGDAEYEGRIVW